MPSSLKCSCGLTLVETAIGLALLAGLGVTTTLLVALARDTTTASRQQVLSLSLARARLEQLHGLTFARYALTSGGAVEVTDLVTDLSGEWPSLGGAGLAASPPDALIVPRPGYEDCLDAQGRWLGTGAEAMRAAAYVRRWTVRRIGEGAAEWAAFEVLVAPAAIVRRATPVELMSNPGVIRLLGARARTAS
jgi:hypothetical protein